jgi:hypothetical protein
LSSDVTVSLRACLAVMSMLSRSALKVNPTDLFE